MRTASYSKTPILIKDLTLIEKKAKASRVSFSTVTDKVREQPTLNLADGSIYYGKCSWHSGFALIHVLYSW